MSMTPSDVAPEQPSPLTEQFVTVAREAVAQAIERHRRLGESIVIWRDGQVVVVPPEEIEPRPLQPPRHMPLP